MKLLLHEVTKTQVEAIRNRPGGTLLLHGPRQIGKFTTALEIARQLNCQCVGTDGDCVCDDDCACASCRQAAGGNHPNIMVVKPDDKQKIGVEPIHELQHQLHYRQYEARGERVVIIKDADRLTLPAEHALLKTLEEPPAGTTIILTTEHPTALLATVLSRCRLIYLAPLPVEQIERFVNERFGPVKAKPAAASSYGLVGRAVMHASDPAGLAKDQERAAAVRELLGVEALFTRLQVAAQIAASASDRSAYLSELTAQTRAGARTNLKAARGLAAIERLHHRLQANVNPKTAFEALAVELA